MRAGDRGRHYAGARRGGHHLSADRTREAANSAIERQALAACQRFVAAHTVRRIVGGVAGPGCQPVCGALLIADISGFSRLSERLALEEGSRGADRLSQILNATLGGLIDVVEEAGAEIVDLAGDAIHAAWFAEAEPDLGPQTRRAAQAALALQGTLAGLADAGRHDLSLHAGLGAGTGSLRLLGGHGERWDVVLTGQLLERAARAVTAAERWAVVASREAWGLLRDRATGAPLEDELWRLRSLAPPMLPASRVPPLEDDPDEAILCLVPDTVRALARAGILGWLAEMRVLTVSFCRIAAAGQLALIDHAVVQRAIRALQEEAAREDGLLDKVHADEKGLTAIIVYGLPPGEAADTAARAARASWRQQARLRELGLAGGIGFATGKSFAGPVGTRHRAQYMLHGIAVNLAARLMQEADAEVLLDEASATLAAQTMDFMSLGKRSFKGFAEAVGVYRLTGPASGAARRGRGRVPERVVGRACELAAFDSFLDRIARGESGAVVLEGESGVGKSTLVAEVVKRARARSIRSLQGAGDKVLATPFLPWAPVFAQLIAGEAERRGTTPKEALFTVLGESHREHAALMSAVLDLDLPEPGALARLDAATRAELTREVMITLIERIGGAQPQLLVIDDAQWCDEGTARLARLILDRLKGQGLLLACRPGRERDAAYWLRQLRFAEPMLLNLQPLDEQATRELVEGYLGQGPQARAAAEKIQGVSEGNPFFASELALALREKRTLEPLSSARRFSAPAAREDVPLTIESVVAERIGHRALAEQVVLKLASVIGDTFAPGLLASLMRDQPASAGIGEILVDLQEAGLLVANAGDHSFRHQIIRMVVYDSLTETDRRHLHRRVAEHLEDSGRRSAGGMAALLAHHWSEAGVASKALGHLARAGELAFRQGAFGEAIKLFSRALELVPQQGGSGRCRKISALRSALWRERLAEAAWSMGDLRLALEHAAAACEMLEARTPASRSWLAVLLVEAARLAARRVAGRWLARRRSPAAPRAPARGLAEAPEVRRGDRLRAAALSRLATLQSESFYFTAGVLPTLASCLRAVNYAEASGDPSQSARSQALLGYASGLARQHALARGFFAGPRSHCIRRRNRLGLQYSLGGEAMYRMSFGDWQGAMTRLRQARNLARQRQNQQDVEIAETLSAMCWYHLGDFRRAIADMEAVRSAARLRGNDQHLAWSAHFIAQALLPLGENDRALGLLEEAAAILQLVEDRQAKLICSALKAAALASCGRLAEAAALTEAQLVRIKEVPPSNVGSLEGFARPAEVLLSRLVELRACGDYRAGAAVHRRAKQALSLAARFGRVFVIARPRLQLLRGWLSAAEGDRECAAAAFRKGRREAARLEMRWEEARLEHAWRLVTAGVGASPGWQELSLARALCGKPERDIAIEPRELVGVR